MYNINIKLNYIPLHQTPTRTPFTPHIIHNDCIQCPRKPSRNNNTGSTKRKAETEQIRATTLPEATNWFRVCERATIAEWTLPESPKLWLTPHPFSKTCICVWLKKRQQRKGARFENRNETFAFSFFFEPRVNIKIAEWKSLGGK